MRRMPMTSVATAAMLVACGGKPASPAAPAASIETTEFAASLGIEPREFTQTTSGMFYADGKRGTGVVAAEGRKATIRYVVWLPSGAEIDAQRAPIEVEVGSALIRGLREGIAGMRVGGIRRLIVPPALGYGRTMYKRIPPNSILVFELELVAVR
jgi:FKBP-type peptidyl-prolyl cis-trans isomerase FkpA